MVWFAALSYQKETFIHFQSTLRSTRFTLGRETSFQQKPESTAPIKTKLNSSSNLKRFSVASVSTRTSQGVLGYLLLFMVVGVFVAQGIASVNFTFATMIAINILQAIAFALLWPDDKNTL